MTFRPVDLDRLRREELAVVVSLSGGKDSTAVALRLRELEIPFRTVFADTGWEADETYRYIDEVLEPLFGPISRVAFEVVGLSPDLEELARVVEEVLGRRSPMVRRILLHATYPRRTLKWCTTDLKIVPIRGFHHRVMEETGKLVVSVVGIRAEESKARAGLEEWDLGDPIDALVWRPLLRATTGDVVDLLRRHGVAPNPLYLRGTHRVGCWPCTMARKEDYAILAGDERRTEVVELLEAIVGDLAEKRARDEGTTLEAKGHRRPTWHHGWPEGNGPLPLMPPIREVLRWGRTSRSGEPRPDREEELALEGCMRWGMCEAPAAVSPAPGSADGDRLEERLDRTAARGEDR